MRAGGIGESFDGRMDLTLLRSTSSVASKVKALGATVSSLSVLARIFPVTVEPSSISISWKWYCSEISSEGLMIALSISSLLNRMERWVRFGPETPP